MCQKKKWESTNYKLQISIIKVTQSGYVWRSIIMWHYIDWKHVIRYRSLFELSSSENWRIGRLGHTFLGQLFLHLAYDKKVKPTDWGERFESFNQIYYNFYVGDLHIHAWCIHRGDCKFYKIHLYATTTQIHFLLPYVSPEKELSYI